MKVKASMLVVLCEYSVHLIVITFFNLPFISNATVYFIPNITIDRLFHNPMLLPISFEHLMVEKFIHSNKWSSFKKSTEEAKVKDIRNVF